jgi:hypothetical protein
VSLLWKPVAVALELSALLLAPVAVELSPTV